MSIQIMGSQGVDNASVYRQASLYSLTLDEVQTQLGNLGKPLSSMNLDDLLRSVWSAEANRFTSIVNNAELNPGQLASGSSLNRQPSFSLSRVLRKKTVDEVWNEIQEERRRNSRNNTNQARNQGSQHTLGEITLEDFLVQAGVVVEAPAGSGDNHADGLDLGVDLNIGRRSSASQHAPWVQYQLIPEQHQQQQQHSMMTIFMHSGPTLDSGYPETERSMSPTRLVETLSDTQVLRRKRVAQGDVVEKTVERRQKRMIKNRESAARSRARKQAYTNELESKIARLEEENERLKRLKEVEKALPYVPLPEPKYQLRRTSSGPF
ncbi:hypothetical protein Nepgr_009927 [Nepenthes gracilis]|uniref:BZIP domain-containing protein n=1 Tax=Nepenthes gracilis TaxID=150966 RepID=A0AAD3SCA2_NEPGR|nr:hypothetical protein Nepgr_009927 [Nepenthes gracilis]